MSKSTYPSANTTAETPGSSSHRIGGVSREAWLLMGSVLAFIAVTVWWWTQDTSVQPSDSGLHILLAFGIHDQLASGNLTGWFTEFNTYPPLAHVVGAIAVFIAGKSPMATVIAINLVFVPLLAASCYGIGRLAYGPVCGPLAGLFALGSPIFVSQMHLFMVDPPETAMVAASVWAILASGRFERVGVAALGGVAVGLAMMTKSTSVIFLAGLVLVVLLRGGWRNWRGLLTFLAISAAISLPWYIYHHHQLSGLVEGQGGTGAAPWEEASPQLLSHKSLLWYFWAALNIQLLAPLILFLVVGLLATITDCVRRFKPENLGPELLGGLFVSWLGITLIRHKDVRFILPALVYVAVLATGWIMTTRRRVRRSAITVLAVFLAADFLGVSIGIGHTVRLALPGASKTSGLHTKQITFYSPEGYVRGGPKRGADMLSMLRGLKRVGIKTVTFDAGSTANVNFSTYGLSVRTMQAGLTPTPVYNPAGLGQHEAFILLHVPQPGDPPPCEKLEEGSGVYAELGDAVKPFETYTLICPTHHPVVYHRTAPLSLETLIQMHPEIVGTSTRTMVLNALLALHSEGAKAIQIDRASANQVFFQPTGVELLAEVAQLPVPPGLTPQQLTSEDAYLLRRPVTTTGPQPCGRFPDGTGLYVIRGNPTVPSPHYLCPHKAPEQAPSSGHSRHR